MLATLTGAAWADEPPSAIVTTPGAVRGREWRSRERRLPEAVAPELVSGVEVPDNAAPDHTCFDDLMRVHFDGVGATGYVASYDYAGHPLSTSLGPHACLDVQLANDHDAYTIHGFAIVNICLTIGWLLIARRTGQLYESRASHLPEAP